MVNLELSLGKIVILVGFILLVIGLLSWTIYIPIFSDTFLGEVGGLVLIYIGIKMG